MKVELHRSIIPVITPDRYNNFCNTSYINQSYTPETFCVGSVGQYRNYKSFLRNVNMCCILDKPDHFCFVETIHVCNIPIHFSFKYGTYVIT